ncbi:hypothetical protein HYDPIDRAFT_24621 [Hydnomerulius pinastri MD-312]|nr:hypothetical protein HYDPIDRAFT_24621 [Hydnomerulius pinastri MD-312]
MATTAPARATPPPSRRSSHSTSTSPPTTTVTRSASSARSALATARATGSSLNSGVSRRASVKGTSGSLGSTPESREVLSASLKHETEKKEQLLVQLQNKDQTIVGLTGENDNLMSSLNAAESRLNELYADQARTEEEMAARIEVADKLRAQVRELEKEKRDIQRRYNEQTSTFEAERQAFYDNEQHLKSRIQSLTQTRKQQEPIRTVDSEPESLVEETEIPSEPPEPTPAQTQDLDDPDSEPAEMTSLRLELSTLSTSYASLQSTLVLLQTQLVDLKRVNNQLQEENESYMILLREKTLSGQFDLMKQVGGAPSTTSGFDEEDDDVDGDDNDVGSLRSTGRNTLDRVDEEAGEDGQDLLGDSIDRRSTDSPRRPHGRHGRRNGSVSHSPSRAPRGESLADLPITGPGLDLAAELGRAENKDILSGDSIDDRSVLNGKGRRKKGSTEQRKVSSSESHDQLSSSNDIEALRHEVKSLKDANKALSLYASKIIDRIIAQEGFEHVLAVDYEKPPPTPTATTAGALKAPPVTSSSSAPAKSSKPRPQSAIFGRATSNPVPATPSEQSATAISPPNPSSSASTKTQRRSMSFDWKSFSMFGGGEKKPENLRPLTLKPGAAPVTGARKLETYEDEEDRRERERLHATMKLMGIDKPMPSPISPAAGSPAAVPMQKSYSSPATPPVTATPGGRFSIFRSRSTTGHSDTSSVNSAPSMQSHAPYGLGISGNGPAELTQEALEQAEAENTLAALDAHERSLSEEIAKGGAGGFTELSPRLSLGDEWRSRRSRKSGGGSGSTVWSAGMSRSGDDPDA